MAEVFIMLYFVIILIPRLAMTKDSWFDLKKNPAR